MGTIGKVVVVVLVAGALAFWVREQVGTLAVRIPSPSELVRNTQVATVAYSSVGSGYMDITGMILLDETGGTPVPFIQYATEGGDVMTKQLIYAGTRGCAAYAGDLPCVAVDESAAYPQLPTGTNVRVRGMRKDDRLLVYQIDVITPSSQAS